MMATAASNTTNASLRHLEVRPEVLGRLREEIIEPDLPIVDPHHHAWDHIGGPRYLFHDVLEDMTDGHNVRASVLVESFGMQNTDAPDHLRPVGETEFDNGLAAMSASGQYGDIRIAAGIVGWVDLSLGARIGEVLDEHIRAGGGRFKGVRPRLVSDPKPELLDLPRPARPDLLSTPEARAALAEIAARGLSMDVWAFQTQMDRIATTCEAFPGLIFVIDHVAGPLGFGPYAGRRDELFAQWKTAVRNLARHDNVRMKLGGLTMHFAGLVETDTDKPPSSDDLVAAWRPHIETSIELFGPNRCMFESNFPVDKAGCSYHVMWNAFKKLASGASPSERARLFSETASEVYRLDLAR